MGREQETLPDNSLSLTLAEQQRGSLQIGVTAKTPTVGLDVWVWAGLGVAISAVRIPTTAGCVRSVISKVTLFRRPRSSEIACEGPPQAEAELHKGAGEAKNPGPCVSSCLHDSG